MVRVVAQPGESADSLLRKFNKKVQSENIIGEARMRDYHLKPSARRKEKIQQARRKYIKSRM